MDPECITTFTSARSPVSVDKEKQINRRACRVNDCNRCDVGKEEKMQERRTPARWLSTENRRRGKRGSLLLSPPHMFWHVEIIWANVREALTVAYAQRRHPYGCRQQRRFIPPDGRNCKAFRWFAAFLRHDFLPAGAFLKNAETEKGLAFRSSLNLK